MKLRFTLNGERRELDVEPLRRLLALGYRPYLATGTAGDLLVLGKPLGVGIYSAALKKEQLSAEGYAAMIDATTKLNTPAAPRPSHSSQARRGAVFRERLMARSLVYWPVPSLLPREPPPWPRSGRRRTA